MDPCDALFFAYRAVDRGRRPLLIRSQSQGIHGPLRKDNLAAAFFLFFLLGLTRRGYCLHLGLVD